MGLATDRVARYMTIAGTAKMSCLAGIGARLPGFVDSARKAETVIVLDGCKLECAARCMREAGCNRFVHVKLHDLGYVKGTCPVSDDLVKTAAGQVREAVEAHCASTESERSDQHGTPPSGGCSCG